MKTLKLTAKWAPKSDYKPNKYELRTKTALVSSSVWQNPKLSLAKVENPKIRGPQDVIIKIKASGLCGSDMHLYETGKDGYVIYPGLARLPCILGHEFAGEIVELGSDVKDLSVSDLVAVEQMIWCGKCTTCRNGLPDYCEYIEELGITLPGGHAEYCKCEAKFCWKLDPLKNITDDPQTMCELGALAEPAAVAYNAIFIKGHGYKPGAYVAIHGAGPIGLAAIALCRAAGAGKVIVLEVSEERIELAKKMGADAVINPLENKQPYKTIFDMTLGKGIDVHVEAAGSMGKTMPIMMKSLAIDAQIVLIGRAGIEQPMYLEQFQTRRNSLVGARGHAGGGTYPNVIRMMASGRMDLMPMVTRRYSLEKGMEAFRQLTKRVDGKILLNMN